ncbi:MAG TPA: methyltransferase [Mycobacteriales bacterium]|nr:methyltransferase [Mycobacteriales bacterium]
MSQYFDEAPAAAHRAGQVELAVDGRVLTLGTDSGVFSGSRIDPGTAILLDTLPPPPPAGHLLDLGCGYGPIALHLAVRAPAATVWAVDVNSRARELAAANAKAAGLDNVRVCHPDDVPADLRLSAMASNPPIRIGKQALHDMLRGWLSKVDGESFLVVQKHLGADSLQRWLEENGRPTTRIRSKKAYRILRVGSA